MHLAEWRYSKDWDISGKILVAIWPAISDVFSRIRHEVVFISVSDQ